jgi:NAD(P)H-dependent FMN reductase
MINIGIVVASTRPGRIGREVGEWVYKNAPTHGAAEYELLDIADFALPLFDESVVPMVTPGIRPHTRRWAASMARLDGFIFVTPEYNHGIPAALKNAIDYVYAEWNNKVAGFVSYGADGGVRAVEQLRGVLAQTRMATVGPQVALSLLDDFRDFHELMPRARHQTTFTTMVADLESWAAALQGVRDRV